MTKTPCSRAGFYERFLFIADHIPMKSFAPTVFQSQLYLRLYQRYFGGGKTFHHLQTDDGEAWLQSRGRLTKQLEMWGAGIHDVGAATIATSSTRSLDKSAIWARIEELSSRHAATQLAQIEANSPLVESARAAKWQILPAETCPVLALPDSWDEYVKSLGKNMREQIKRYPKRLEKEFTVEYSMSQTAAETSVALSDLIRLHTKRWRARGQTGVLVLPRRQQFQRALCEDLRQQNQLRLWTATVNGEAACVLLSYFYDGRYSFFIGGFEPDLMRWSVGTCLFAQVLRHAIEVDGAREFDFLKGREEYKYRLGAQDREYVTLQRFQKSAGGAWLRRKLALEKTLMHKFHERFSAAFVDKKSGAKNEKS